MSREYGTLVVSRGRDKQDPFGQGTAWYAQLLTGEDHTSEERMRDGSPSKPHEYPVKEVMRALDRLGGHGWQVVHVSEDRGLFESLAGAGISGVIQARYLLCRDAS